MCLGIQSHSIRDWGVRITSKSHVYGKIQNGDHWTLRNCKSHRRMISFEMKKTCTQTYPARVDTNQLVMILISIDILISHHINNEASIYCYKNLNNVDGFLTLQQYIYIYCVLPIVPFVLWRLQVYVQQRSSLYIAITMHIVQHYDEYNYGEY